MAHLVKRVRQREISTAQLGLFARWLDSDPEVPEGQWFKRFPEMIVCGEGEWSRGDASDIMRKPRGRMKRLGKTDIEGKAAMGSAKGRARIELTSGLD